MAGRLELISGWLHSDVAVRAVLSQAMTASKEDKKVTSQAIAARDAALKDASTVKGHCKTLEGKLQGLCDELTKEVHDRQVKEEEMKAQEVVVRDRDAKLSADCGPAEDAGADAGSGEG